MTTLDEHDRELLAGYKAAISPSDDVARSNWEAIAEQAEEELEDDEVRAGGRRWWWLGVGAAVVAVVSYVELRVSSGTELTVDPAGAQAVDQVAPPLPSRAEPGRTTASSPVVLEEGLEPEVLPAPPVEPVEPDAERPPSETSPAATPEPSARVRRRSTTAEAEAEPAEPEPEVEAEREAPEPSASASDLHAEMALLGRARAALTAEDFEQALSLVDRYDREHPHGTMQEEAAALRVGALCEAGPKERWKRALRRFQRDFPASPLETHLDDECFD